MNTDTKPAALTEKARHLAMLQDMRAYSANDFQKPALDYAIAALQADDATTPPAKTEAAPPPPVDGMVLVVWDDLRKAYEEAAEYTGEWCIGIDDELIRRCDEARARLAAVPATPAGKVDAFEAGWRCAAAWSDRDDLFADIGSPAYLREREKALGVHPEPVQGENDQ